MKKAKKFKSGHDKKIVARWNRASDMPVEDWMHKKGTDFDIFADLKDRLSCFNDDGVFLLLGKTAEQGIALTRREIKRYIDRCFKRLNPKDFKPLCANSECSYYRTVEEFGDVCPECYKTYLELENESDE